MGTSQQAQDVEPILMLLLMLMLVQRRINAELMLV